MPITYTLVGTISGTLSDAQGAVSDLGFTNTPFVWRVTADTVQAITVDTHGGLVTEVPAATDTIALGGTVLFPTNPDLLRGGLRAVAH